MERAWMATAAGILNIVSGGLALIGALTTVVFAGVLSILPAMTAEPADDLPLGLAAGVLWALVLLCLVAALLMIVGGVAALRRSGWGWPLTGAVTALFCATPLGIFALVFVVMAEQELRGGGATALPVATQTG